MRLEKAYRAWGHELSTDETSLEAGLGFAIDWQTEFLGKEALLEQKAKGLRKRLVAFVLEDAEPALWGSEPILRDGELVGYTTSGAVSPTLGRSVALGYVKGTSEKLASADLLASSFEIVNDGQRCQARPSLRAPYDPDRRTL